MARIFIAIRFNDEFKRKLVEIQDSLNSRGVKGNYSSYGNLHMTLAFIGEHYDLPAIQKAVGEVEFEPFDLSLGNLGTFPTKAGVIWCGVKMEHLQLRLPTSYENGLLQMECHSAHLDSSLTSRWFSIRRKLSQTLKFQKRPYEWNKYTS